jgi:hypothetical protein
MTATAMPSLGVRRDDDSPAGRMSRIHARCVPQIDPRPHLHNALSAYCHAKIHAHCAVASCITRDKQYLRNRSTDVRSGAPLKDESSSSCHAVRNTNTAEPRDGKLFLTSRSLRGTRAGTREEIGSTLADKS